jgi:hypothetical protein
MNNIVNIDNNIPNIYLTYSLDMSLNNSLLAVSNFIPHKF